MLATKKSHHHSASSPPRYLFAAEDNTDDRSEHVWKNKYTRKTSMFLTWMLGRFLLLAYKFSFQDALLLSLLLSF